jgi:hypothetical protein
MPCSCLCGFRRRYLVCYGCLRFLPTSLMNNSDTPHMRWALPGVLTEFLQKSSPRPPGIFSRDLDGQLQGLQQQRLPSVRSHPRRREQQTRANKTQRRTRPAAAFHPHPRDRKQPPPPRRALSHPSQTPSRAAIKSAPHCSPAPPPQLPTANATADPFSGQSAVQAADIGPQPCQLLHSLQQPACASQREQLQQSRRKRRGS